MHPITRPPSWSAELFRVEGPTRTRIRSPATSTLFSDVRSQCPTATTDREFGQTNLAILSAFGNWLAITNRCHLSERYVQYQLSVVLHGVHLSGVRASLHNGARLAVNAVSLHLFIHWLLSLPNFFDKFLTFTLGFEGQSWLCFCFYSLLGRDVKLYTSSIDSNQLHACT